MAATTPARTHTPAKRGDIVIIQTHHSDYIIGQGSREYDAFTIGLVTGVTRDGMVRTCRKAGEHDYYRPSWAKPDKGHEISRVVGFVKTILLPAAVADPTGVLATAECHTFPKSTTVMPYDTLDEVRAAVTPHRLDNPAHGALRTAALAHGQAVREAWEAYYGDGRQGYDTERSKVHTAAVETANDTYRAAHEAARAGQNPA